MQVTGLFDLRARPLPSSAKYISQAPLPLAGWFLPLCVCVCVCVCARVCVHAHAQLLSLVQPSATPWTVAHQAPLSTGFPRQEDWSGLPFPSPRDRSDPGTELVSLVCPALAGEFFHCTPWEALVSG